MLISELIDKLEEMMIRFGNVPVYIPVYDKGVGLCHIDQIGEILPYINEDYDYKDEIDMVVLK